MAKILKNTTLSDIDLDVLATTIPASGQITVDVESYILLASDDSITELTTLINSGDITVNNGLSDLDAEDGLDFIRYPDRADAIYVDDSGLTFDADDIQEAFDNIDAIVAPLVVPIALVYNGTLSDNEFIGYSNLLPGDTTPIISPLTGSFVGFTWSNSRSNADFALEFRKNSTVATPFFTWSVDNTKTADVTLITSENFNAGDEIYVKYIDEGQNAADATIVLKFRN